MYVVRDDGRYSDGSKHFLIGVVAQVCERWEVSRYKKTPLD